MGQLFRVSLTHRQSLFVLDATVGREWWSISCADTATITGQQIWIVSKTFRNAGFVLMSTVCSRLYSHIIVTDFVPLEAPEGATR